MHEASLDLFRRYESPGTKTFALTETPPVFVSGEGATLTDSTGRVYLDFACGSGTSALGHGHPAIRAAIEKQVQSGILHIGPHFHTTSQHRLFELLSDLLPPHLDCYHPATNGTEATEVALKIAMHATGRSRFLVFEGGYHGRTLGALGVSAERGANRHFGPLFPAVDVLCYPSIDSVDLADPRRRSEVADQVRSAMMQLTGPYAGVIIEPVQATAGMRIAPHEALRAVAEVSRDRGWPLIVDEVFTAFGRAEGLLYSHTAGVEADLVILAKGLGGGIPAGLVVGRRRLMRGLPRGAQSSTFQLHPLAAAASVAMLDVLVSEGLDARARAIGERISARRGELRACDAVLDVRGLGGLWGIEIRRHRHGHLTKSIRHAALELGLVTWECGLQGEVIGLVPPLIVSDVEIDRAIDIMVQAVKIATG